MKLDQNPMYGMYYDDNDDRIDQGVNEVIDTNPYYGQKLTYRYKKCSHLPKQYVNIKLSNKSKTDTSPIRWEFLPNLPNKYLFVEFASIFMFREKISNSFFKMILAEKSSHIT